MLWHVITEPDAKNKRRLRDKTRCQQEILVYITKDRKSNKTKIIHETSRFLDFDRERMNTKYLGGRANMTTSMTSRTTDTACLFPY